MTVIVDVTADDIRRGEPGSCRKCPVALAVGRSVAGAVGVTKVGLLVGDDHPLSVVLLPDVAQDFVRLFDVDKVGPPFKFPITVQARHVRTPGA